LQWKKKGRLSASQKIFCKDAERRRFVCKILVEMEEGEWKMRLSKKGGLFFYFLEFTIIKKSYITSL